MNCVKSFFVVVGNRMDSSRTMASTTTTTTTEQNATLTAVLKHDYIHIVVADQKDSTMVWVGKLRGKSNFDANTTIDISDKDVLNAFWKSLDFEVFKGTTEAYDIHTKNQKLSMCRVTHKQLKENEKSTNTLQINGNYHVTKDIVLPISCTLFPTTPGEETSGVLLQMFSNYIRLLVQDVATVTAQKDQLKNALRDCEHTLSLQQDKIDNQGLVSTPVQARKRVNAQILNQAQI